MGNMRVVTKPKSDQLNYENFLGGITLIVKIDHVTYKAGEQPLTIHYEGEDGRPYKPNKTMCKIMQELWGEEETEYAGKSMTLYGNPKVVYGGQAVGGIEISHMSHIRGTATLTLTVSRGKKAVFVIKPLTIAPDAPTPLTRDQYTAITDACKSASVTSADLLAHFGLGKMSAVTVAMLPDVMAWVQDRHRGAGGAGVTPCPQCQQTGSHAASCPLNEPPEGE